MNSPTVAIIRNGVPPGVGLIVVGARAFCGCDTLAIHENRSGWAVAPLHAELGVGGLGRLAAAGLDGRHARPVLEVVAALQRCRKKC